MFNVCLTLMISSTLPVLNIEELLLKIAQALDVAYRNVSHKKEIVVYQVNNKILYIFKKYLFVKLITYLLTYENSTFCTINKFISLTIKAFLAILVQKASYNLFKFLNFTYFA
jgi:hypothetical protein